jgi:predicted DNA-binding mobile mystery protein A
MDWTLRKMRAKQIENQLKGVSKLSRPESGWVKTIRETLGMNTRQLGKRCNVSSERIIRIESDEMEGRTTLATLEKIAQAMNCRVVYAIVPNDGMIEFIEKTAEDKAKTQLQQTSHHMALEDQEISIESMKEQIHFLKEELLKNNIKHIWDK